MDYQDLFKNGSLKFIADFISKIVHSGLGMEKNKGSWQIVYLASTLIVVFLLYKLVWMVWGVIKFLLSLLEW